MWASVGLNPNTSNFSRSNSDPLGLSWTDHELLWPNTKPYNIHIYYTVRPEGPSWGCERSEDASSITYTYNVHTASSIIYLYVQRARTGGSSWGCGLNLKVRPNLNPNFPNFEFVLQNRTPNFPNLSKKDRTPNSVWGPTLISFKLW